MIANEHRETVIAAVLQLLDAAHPSGLTAAQMMIPIKLSGLPRIDHADVESLLDDLEGLKWVEKKISAAAGEVVRWKRTETGRVWLRLQGL